jgi:hypothetical protein
MSKALRVVALLLAALSLTTTSAHVLELPEKMHYSPLFYALVNATLYRWFAIVGGLYTVAAIVAAWAFAASARPSPRAFRWAFAGASLLTLALASWLALVMPVNGAVARGIEESPSRVPALWAQLRPYWEYGHVAGFILQLSGFVALAIAAVADSPGAPVRAIRASASTLIRAPQDTVFALYADWEHWPRLFPRTIRGVRLVASEGSSRTIDVDHSEGHVPNVMSIVSPELIVLDEHKRRYDARFENHFEPLAGSRGTRYAVTAAVTLHGKLRWLGPLAKPLIRSRIRRYLLDPLRRAAEEEARMWPAATAFVR